MAEAEKTSVRFGIENFKPYADFQSIELGKITLIYGSNSSGKSSFIQSFLCATQSSESTTISLSLNGDLIKCGTYDSVLNKKIKNKKKDIVLGLSSTLPPSEESFTVKEGAKNADISIYFSRNFDIDVRAFFGKGSTPGILEINKINLLLPQINCFNNLGPEKEGAWLQKNSPLPHSKSLHNLEDIDGTWMLMCTKMIRSMAEELKNCLRILSAKEENGSQSRKSQVGYAISGKLEDLNLLYCASLSIGAWLTVISSDKIKNTFDGFIFPPSMAYLEGEYFHARDLGYKIKELHEKLSQYYSCIENLSNRYGKIRYALGDVHKASWGAIPVAEESVEELLESMKNDGDCLSFKREIESLSSEINEQIAESMRLGSSLMSELGEYSQRLMNICESLDKLNDDLRRMLDESLIQSTRNRKESTNDSEIEASIFQGLARLFRLSEESIKCLADSFDFLSSTQAKIGLDINASDDRVSFNELDLSISECKSIFDGLKRLYGSLEDATSFIEFTVRLSDQIKVSQRMIASKANDLDYLAASGKKEDPAIKDVTILMDQIQKYFKVKRENKFSFASPRSIVFENGLDFIPVISTIKILPSSILKDRILHLGPDRPTPKRSYGIEEIKSDLQLLELPEWDSEKEDLFPESHQHKYAKELNCLDLPGTDIVRVNTSDPLLDKCSIGILKDKEITNICDLGFGISQVMPLVIASKIPNKDMIVVQQPETHLHPKMQADLGDLLISSIDKKRWLLETHSEVLMLRILRRIREGKLLASDLKIYFVDQRDGGARIINMKFTNSGDLITRWPKGFFAQESLEIF